MSHRRPQTAPQTGAQSRALIADERSDTMKMTFTAIVALMLLALLAGCGGNGSKTSAFMATNKRQLFDGAFYPVKLSADDADLTAFVVAVDRAAQGLTGAREAGDYEATKYCIAQFGNSSIDWTVGPETPDSGLVFQGDTLVLSGSCKGWQ